jgi:hypothetical protein
MRIRIWFQAAVAVGALSFSASTFAQFQPPTSEELQMKSEPKAPGAAAIYLYREETVDDNLHFHSFYARIKVLTEKGKELATQGVPYPKGTFSVTDVKARTIHADGTIIPLDVKPSDLVERRGTGAQINRMVFTLPSVEVGSILEYRWEIRYDDGTLSSPYWDLQQPYFVRKAHYLFVPFKYLDRVTNGNGDNASRLMYSTMLPKTASVVRDATGKYTLDVSDVDAIPNEEYMPPLGTMIEQVQFYYTPYISKEEFWAHEGSRWSKEMDKFANQTKTLKEEVSGIVAPGDSEEDKARKIYDKVMTLENTDYTRRKSKEELKKMGLKQTKQAEDVWKQKSGSSDEIALLYLAMARIAGLKAYAMTVCDRNREVFNPYFMQMSQFDDVLVIVSIGGKDKFLDPGKKFAPFGQLDWRHALSAGLRQAEKGTELSGTPNNSYKDATTLRIGDVTIDKDGSVTGTVRLSMNGPAAVRWRELAIENDEDEVKKQFNEHLKGMMPDGVTADFDHFLGLEDYHAQLMGIVKVSGNIGNSTGKRVFLPGVFFESRTKHPFVATEHRITAIDMEYAESIQDEVTYHVPDTYKVESSPSDTSIPWSGHAVFALKSVVDKNKIVVARSFVRGFAIVEPKDYATLREFYQKVATADQQPLVLTVDPAAAAVKGN